MIPDLEECSVDLWGVPLSLTGADVLVPQENTLSLGVGSWRIIFHGITRPGPECVNIGDQRYDSSKMA